VTHQFKNLDGTAASGQVAFRLSGQMTNGVSYDDKVPLHSPLDSNGNLSAVLPANNDPGTFPTSGIYYTVTFMLNGATAPTIGEPFMVMLPYDAAGGTIDLAELMPQTTGDGV
jgi:hypothetical protein